MSFTAGVMSSCWSLDSATRVGSGRHDERNYSKEGATVTMAAVGGQHDESAR